MTDAFDELRPLLFSIGYRMTGTHADAEDAVQDTYMRWQAADRASIQSPKAFLTTVISRVCLDVLKSSRRKREVYVGDEEIRLAPKEFDLLWELLDHRGIVLTRDQLLERVWGYTFAGDTRTVDVHVRQIRRKLGDASPIVTVWGVGYKVASDRTAATI